MISTTIGAIKIFGESNTPPEFNRTYGKNYRKPDAVFGWRPTPSQVTHSKSMTSSGELIYDVLYTIDEFGFRTIKYEKATSETYLFFGGSYTFGEGVFDEEAYPYLFSKSLNHEYEVINLGWHGYGPHHMLRSIETGIFNKAINNSVKRAFFLMIPDHINRTAGFYWWNKESPRYVLEEDGSVKSTGLHSEVDHSIEYLFRNRNNGSLSIFVDFLYENWFMPKKKRIELSIAVIKKSSFLLKELYGTELVCLIWDSSDAWAWSEVSLDRFERDLKAEGLKIIRVSEFLGDLDDPKYKIHNLEKHPSAIAHNRLGLSLADWVKANP